MTTFRYKSITSEGVVRKGHMDAPSRAAVLARLEERGDLPVQAEEADAPKGRSQRGTGFGWRRVTPPQLTTLTREMARLLTAGIPLERVMDILIEVAENTSVRRLLQRVFEGVRAGKPLADTMEENGPPFDRLYVNMVRAGEAGGSLDVVMARLAEHLERVARLKASITAALTYPIILIFVALGSLVLMMAYVVPQFESLFAGAGDRLPESTRTLIDVAHWVTASWWQPLVALLAVLLIGPRILRRPGAREIWDRTLLLLPIFGDLIRKLEVARFSRTLSALLANGVPVLTALSVVKEGLTNTVFVAAIKRAIDGLKAGQGLASPLIEQQVFPRLAAHMVRVGEETGQLEAMLIDVADIYDEEVQRDLKKILALLEPLLILTLGILMGGIIMSILSAIMSVNELAF